MKSYRLILICGIFFCLQGWGLQAQGVWVLDDSNLPVEGALVELLSLDQKHIMTAITDSNGFIEVKNQRLPMLIRILHINFLAFNDTLTSFPKTFQLVPATIQLDEVVVTGQYFPQSASRSLYKVRTINPEKIEAFTPTEITQLLNQELNLQINNDLTLGSSGLSIQGLGGNNIKFLIDGVPVVGRTGNNFDLGQIDLNSIERIEIVEGPMAVNYGSNALAGVVNLITRRPDYGGLNLNAYIHEETVGEEYGFEKGIHQQGVQLSGTLVSTLTGQLNLQRHYFGGFQGEAAGRAREWLPKTQYKSFAALNFGKNGLDLSYKINFLEEVINNDVEPSSIFNPIALDEEYQTNRWIHTVQWDQSLPKGRLNLITSYTDYERKKIQFANNLATGEKLLSQAPGAQDKTRFDTWNIRGTYSHLVNTKVNFEAGFDLNLDNTAGSRIIDEKQKMEDLGVFGSAEIDFGKLKVRPGFRYNHNSVFDGSLVPSINIKYDVNPNAGFRMAYGMGFRSPTLRELYFEFLDVNHSILGNPNLNPEQSHHADINYEVSLSSNKVKPSLQFGVFYNSVKDQIEFGQGANPQVISFINISRFESLGFTFSPEFIFKNLSAGMGFSYTGRKSELSAVDNDPNDFLFNVEIKSNLSYRFPKADAGISLFYGYTGKIQQIQFSPDANGDLIFTKGTADSWHWMDLSGSKSFGRHFKLGIGARNLFNLRRINSTLNAGTAHSAGNFRSIGYGRSFYLRLQYNL